jgi:formiminotetrahydrofolate cyclodeaminase
MPVCGRRTGLRGSASASSSATGRVRPYNRCVEPSARFRDLTVAGFVERLASDDPVPGGGSAAAVAASLAAGLVAMVASLSKDRPKYAQHAALHQEAADAARALADRFLALADEDAEAYAGFGAAMKLPRDTDEEKAARSAAISNAAQAASDVPYRTVEACLEVVVLAEALAGRSNANASSDLEVAALLATAASRAAAANVYVNLPSIGDQAAADELLADTQQLVGDIDRLAAQTRELVLHGEARAPIEVGRA